MQPIFSRNNNPITARNIVDNSSSQLHSSCTPTLPLWLVIHTSESGAKTGCRIQSSGRPQSSLNPAGQPLIVFSFMCRPSRSSVLLFTASTSSWPWAPPTRAGPPRPPRRTSAPSCTPAAQPGTRRQVMLLFSLRPKCRQLNLPRLKRMIISVRTPPPLLFLHHLMMGYRCGRPEWTQ